MGETLEKLIQLYSEVERTEARRVYLRDRRQTIHDAKNKQHEFIVVADIEYKKAELANLEAELAYKKAIEAHAKGEL